ncbi:MAG: ABC transporter ATP-binding protein [Clostridia bacterium]|nr:ABC transporter ATP-binding protein [Clostridia bacterium]
MEELMLKIDSVSKLYKLGQIGGTTLREDLQRLGARLRGKEDPTKRIGAKDYKKGETFLALDGVSFEVKKGERVGIIGHNGAGKSTLLKLISRVTAPTGGRIDMNGRVASMLEVGTGFHPELTGRENVYMNGAILGMTKKEIDAKVEQIIDFSECRQFIDTPVKRYSSGMYVKLAFSVAAHLDSEIMIMDEVLAVGDMAFQKKCLDKMNDVSGAEGRTILYVSHNMNTIRELCDRVIVLDHGKVVFDGGVEDGIDVYSGLRTSGSWKINYQSSPELRVGKRGGKLVRFLSAEFVNQSYYQTEPDKIRLKIRWEADSAAEDICLRFEVKKPDGTPIGTACCFDINTEKNRQNGGATVVLDASGLVPGRYMSHFVLFTKNSFGSNKTLDVVRGLDFELTGGSSDIVWNSQHWGNIRFPDMELE